MLFILASVTKNARFAFRTRCLRNQPAVSTCLCVFVCPTKGGTMGTIRGGRKPGFPGPVAVIHDGINFGGNPPLSGCLMTFP